MDLQPTLTGDLLLLRPLRHEDFEALYLAASDPLIWELHPQQDRYTRPVFQKYFDSGIELKGAFAIIDRKTGEIIGSSRYHDYDPVGKSVEIGYTFLTRAYWGGEYNRELKGLMLEHAYKWVDVARFFIGGNNFRSQRAVEKIGAIRVGSKSDERGVTLQYNLPRELADSILKM